MAVELNGKEILVGRQSARKRLGSLAIGVISCCMLACDGDSSSDSDSSTSGKLVSFGLVVADINRDSLPDIVTANTDFSESGNPGSVKVILNDGVTLDEFENDVEFENGVFYPMGADTRDVLARYPGDTQNPAVDLLDSDGKPDVMATSRSEAALYYRLQAALGNGRFGDEEQLEVGLRAGAMAFADMNRDGRDDIIVSGSSLVIWLLDPGFDLIDPADDEYIFGGREAISGQALAVANLNDDNRPDIVVTSGDNEISVLLQDTTLGGNFFPVFLPAIPYAVGSGPADIAIGNLNGDGRPDIAVANANSVSVLLQQLAPLEDGVFRAAVNYEIEGGGTQLVIKEIDADDTRLDIAVTNNLAVGGGISVFLQDPDRRGEFFLDTFIRATSPWGLDAADFNKDGYMDFAFSNVNGASVVLQSRRFPGEFLFPELVGGDNNADD